MTDENKNEKYVFRWRRNRNGITVENLSSILKRNDIKKSDVYQSGLLEGTTPAYEAYIRLKKRLHDQVAGS